MATIRWQLRGLFLALMAIGILWVDLMNYVRLGNAWQNSVHQGISALVYWGGAAALGLLLDLLAGLRLRRFFAALARVEAGEALPPATAHPAVRTAIRFPAEASLFLLVMSVFLSFLFHFADLGPAFLPTLADPATRGELLNTILRHIVVALFLAILLFTFSQRFLQRGVASFALRDVPDPRRIPLGARVGLIVFGLAVTYTSIYATLPANVPSGRMLFFYLPLALLTGVVGYLVAADTGRDLNAIAGRLRVLAGRVRPDLFHRLPVTGQDEVTELLAAINALQDRVEAEFRAIERDLQAARSIQTELLPRTWQAPPGWDLAVRLLPAQAVGGDFYDLIPLPGGRLGIAVGDAAGKGLPAALLMASTISLLRSHAPLHASPAAVLAAVNRLLCGSLPPMTFVTAAYGILDPERRQITLASAGHLPPLVDGREAEPLSALPLGVEPEARYAERTYDLAPGSSFVLYSDGLPEAAGADGALFGTAGLAAALAATGERLSEGGASGPATGAAGQVERLLAAVAAHAAGRPLADDIVVLSLVAPRCLRLEVPSQHGAELEAARAAAEFAHAHGPAGRAEDVETAVGEACLNALIHGNGLRPELPVVLELTAGPDWLEATVADQGPPFTPPEDVPSLAEQMAGDGPFHGFGLQLIRSTADEMRIEALPRGKQVRLRFTAGGGSSV